jgi:hypothetical protein
MEIQGYCDKETQYRNTSAIHHASDLAFEPIDLDVEPFSCSVMHLKVRYQGVVRSAFCRYLSP